MSDKFFKSVVGCLLLAIFGSAVISATQPPEAPEALAERTKNEQVKKLAHAYELERIKNSPKMREKTTQIILANQFPGECGGGVTIIRTVSDGQYARCDYSDSTFVVSHQRGIAARLNP